MNTQVGKKMGRRRKAWKMEKSSEHYEEYKLIIFNSMMGLCYWKWLTCCCCFFFFERSRQIPSAGWFFCACGKFDAIFLFKTKKKKKINKRNYNGSHMKLLMFLRFIFETYLVPCDFFIWLPDWIELGSFWEKSILYVLLYLHTFPFKWRDFR